MKLRISALAAAMAVALGCTACNAKPMEDASISDRTVRNDAEKSSSLTVTVSHAYASEQVLDGLYYVTETWRIGDLTAVVSFTEGYENTLTIFDAASDSIAAVFIFPISRKPIGVTETSDGWNICLRDMQEDGSNVYRMQNCDKDWNVISESDVTAQIGAETCVTALRRDGSGNYAILTTDEIAEVMILNENFQKLGSVTSAGGWIHSILVGSDGEIYAYYNTGGSEAVGHVDQTDWVLERLQFEDMPKSPAGIGEGSDDCDFLVYDADAAYGVDAETGACEKIIDWLSSDFTSGIHASSLPNGRFFVTEYDVDTRISTGWVLRQKTQEELERLEIITLSMLSDDRALEKAVSRYNRQSGDIRIVIENYAKYDTEGNWEESLAKFKQDMVENKVADIICTDGLPFASFANKGLFEDLYPYMEADADFRESDYFMNFFGSMEYSGELLQLCSDFRISTAIGKTEFLGERQGLNFAEYLELAQSLPEGMDMFPNMNRSNALHALGLASLSQLVDEEAAACRFDSAEFVDLLELCGSYPSKMDMTVTYAYEELAYRDNAALLHSHSLYSPYSFHAVKEGIFANEDITLLGNPTTDGGNGAFFVSSAPLAMSSQSQYKAEVWDFFRYLLSEAYQDSLRETFPVRRSSLHKQMDEAMTKTDGLFSLGEQTIELGPAAQEEMDMLLAYIEETTANGSYDSEVYNIVYEEAGMYFAGDQTAQQAAKMIQSRVSLYLSEQS